MEVKEIKHDDIHCFSDCGFKCKARVLEELTAHYTAMLEDAGEGWQLRTWHNCGWHVELFHPLSGFYLSDYAVRGGPYEVRHDDYEPHRRYYCHNYGQGETSQIRTWGATPDQAIREAVNLAFKRSDDYAEIATKLRAGGKNETANDITAKNAGLPASYEVALLIGGPMDGMRYEILYGMPEVKVARPLDPDLLADINYFPIFNSVMPD